MALTLNGTAVDAIANTGLDPIFNGGRLRIYSGAKPATANLAPTGTLLADITLPADAFSAASGGSGQLAKLGTWEDTAADAGGTAGWFRMSASGDTLVLDAAFARIDGTVGTTGADLNLDNTNIALNQRVTINTATLTIPKG